MSVMNYYPIVTSYFAIPGSLFRGGKCDKKEEIICLVDLVESYLKDFTSYFDRVAEQHHN